MTTNKYAGISVFLHSGMALAFISAYISSYLAFFAHFVFGAIFAAFLVCQIIWLFLAPDLANIKTYNFSGFVGFFKDALAKDKFYDSHNPLASVVGVLIFGVSFLCAMFGFLALYANEFAPNKDDFFLDVHDALSIFVLFLACTHIVGVVLDKIIFKNETYKKMIPKYFLIGTKEVFICVLLVCFLFVFYRLYGVFSFAPQATIDKTYVKECTGCHFAYPATLYNQASWKNIMLNLGEHYGDDAQIDNAALRNKILAYVLENANSNPKTSKYLGDVIVNGMDSSIAESDEFKRLHEKANDKKTDFASCDKCHSDASSGYFRLLNARINHDKNSSN